MTIFNPNVPGANEPNYLGLSKSITQPEADKTMEALFKGIGHTLTAAVSGIDTVIKEDIRSNVEDQAGKLQEQYTADLEQTKAIAVASGGKTATATPSLTEDNEAGGGEDIPADINRDLNTVANMASARTNGKMTQTYYLQNLLSIATSLRQRHPGYREYIDQQISSITGVKPANAYIKSLIGDINTMATNNASEQNKTLTWLRSHFGEVPDAPQIAEAYRRGLITTNDVDRAIYPRLKAKADFDYQKAELDNIKGGREREGMVAGDVMQKRANEIASQALDTMVVTGGLGQPEKVADLLTRFKKGEATVSDEQWTQISLAVSDVRDRAYRQLKAEFNSPINGGRSLAQRGGPKAEQEFISNGLAWIDSVARAISDKDIPAALTAATLAKAQSSDSLNTIMKDYPVIKLMKTFGDISPEFAAMMYKTTLMQGFNQKDSQAVLSTLMKLSAQPDLRLKGTPNAPDNPTGQVYTPDQAIKDAKAAGASDRAIQQIVEFNKQILNPQANDIVKTNLAKSLFSEGNVNYLDNFYREGTNGPNGKPVQNGRYTNFQNLTSPEMTKEIMRLGQKDPQLMRDYINWANRSFSEQLFSREILDLNQMQNFNRFYVTWDSENKQFGVKEMPLTTDERMARQMSGGARIPGFAGAERTINRINGGISGLKNVAEAGKFDVDTYILQLMMNHGFNPSNLTMNSFPQMMVRAIVSSRASQEMNKTKKKPD